MTPIASDKIAFFLNRLDTDGLSYGRFMPELIYIVIPASYDPAWILSDTGIPRQDFEDMVENLGEGSVPDVEGISIRLNADLQAVCAFPYPEELDETILPKALLGKSGEELTELLKKFCSLLNPDSLAETDLEELNRFYLGPEL